MVDMDAFRSIHPNILTMGGEPRISTGNAYHLKPQAETMARIRGLGKLYYNLIIESVVTDEAQINILSILKQKHWTQSIKLFPNEKTKDEKRRKKEDKEGFIKQ